MAASQSRAVHSKTHGVCPIHTRNIWPIGPLSSIRPSPWIDAYPKAGLMYIEAARLKNLELDGSLWAEPIMSSRVLLLFFPSRFRCLLSKKTFEVWSSLVTQKRDECCRKWFGSLARPSSGSTRDSDVTPQVKRVIQKARSCVIWVVICGGSSTSLDTFRSFEVPSYAAPVLCAEKPSPEEDWSSQLVLSLCRDCDVCDLFVICEDVANDARSCQSKWPLCIAVGDSSQPGFAESNSHYLASCDIGTRSGAWALGLPGKHIILKVRSIFLPRVLDTRLVR